MRVIADKVEIDDKKTKDFFLEEVESIMKKILIR